jgi:hypothetical protein
MRQNRCNREDCYWEGDFHYDWIGRIKEWKCPRCGLCIGVSLLNYPDCTVGMWRAKYAHEREHEVETKNAARAVLEKK